MLPRGHPSRTRAGSTATITPPPTQVKEAPAVSGVASFGLGCFWGGQIAFGCAEDIVSTTIVGYMGGEPASANYAPTYGDYAEHGYTETVELVYDAEQGDAAYEQLLAVFWASHNPTSPIEGTAYRSVIFVHNEQQERLSLRSIAARNQELVATDFCRGRCGQPAVVPCYVDGCAVFTTVEEANGVAFWPAEEYHQNWYAKLGETCDSEGYVGVPWSRAQQALRAGTATRPTGGAAPGSGH